MHLAGCEGANRQLHEYLHMILSCKSRLGNPTSTFSARSKTSIYVNTRAHNETTVKLFEVYISSVSTFQYFCASAFLFLVQILGQNLAIQLLVIVVHHIQSGCSA